jgi:hypothetical protein
MHSPSISEFLFVVNWFARIDWQLAMKYQPFADFWPLAGVGHWTKPLCGRGAAIPSLSVIESL